MYGELLARVRFFFQLLNIVGRLPGKGNSDSHGARPVHLIITMIRWIRTSMLSIKNSLSPQERNKGVYGELLARVRFFFQLLNIVDFMAIFPT